MILTVWAMFLLLVLLAGLVVLLVRWPKHMLAVMGALVVVVVLLGAMMFGLRVQHHAGVIEPMPQILQLPVDWDPDVYPSIREAMLSRVAMMPRVIRNLTGGAYPPARMHVSGDVDIDLVREFAERLGAEEAFSDARITWRTGDAPANADVIHVTVNMQIDRRREQHWSHNGVRHDFSLWREGRVMITAARGGGTASLVPARFIEKPWVEDWSGFVANTEPGQNWIRAESHQPATHPHEAQHLAIAQAVNMLMPMVQVSLHGESPGREDLARQVSAQLAQGRLITDRFIQRVDRPYGQLYTATLLIDGAPAAVNGLAMDLAQVHVVRRQGVIWTAVSLAALMGVIGLLYLFLNVVTKGYYRPQLVAVSVGAIVLVLAVLMLA